MAEALDAFLTRRTGWTWAAVRRAIQCRRVQVGGVVCKRYHRQLTAAEAVELDGAVVADGPDLGTLVCHKPGGLACSHADCDRPLLYDLVPPACRHPNLQTAGRLDRDTTGLIILTIDGRFQISITAPARALWKRYRIRYRGQLDRDAGARVAGGLLLPEEERACLPARLALDGEDADGCGLATLELCEGRHHQVKRMVRALGGQVVGLHRDRIGALALPLDLAPGDLRVLRADERLLLFA
jgi:16S rRNA pseudouridine516 synthase